MMKKPALGDRVARRIVIRKSSGAYQIIGVLNGDMAPSQLPTILESIAELDGGTCELAQVEPRYVLYREFLPQPSNVDGA